jgi:hypothetical protein
MFKIKVVAKSNHANDCTSIGEVYKTAGEPTPRTGSDRRKKQATSVVGEAAKVDRLPPSVASFSFGSSLGLPTIQKLASKAATLTIGGLNPAIAQYVTSRRIGLAAAFALTDAITDFGRNGRRPLVRDYFAAADLDTLTAAGLLRQVYNPLGSCGFTPTASAIEAIANYKPAAKTENLNFADPKSRFAAKVGLRRE